MGHPGRGQFQAECSRQAMAATSRRFSALLADHEPVISRVRTPRGRRGVYAVRIGADDRANADFICQQLRGAGGACMVVRNR